MGMFANSEDPDEMQHAAFHHGLHCLVAFYHGLHCLQR